MKIGPAAFARILRVETGFPYINVLQNALIFPFFLVFAQKSEDCELGIFGKKLRNVKKV